MDDDTLTKCNITPRTADGFVSRRLLEHLLELGDGEFDQFGRYIDTLARTWDEAMDIREGNVEGGN